MVMNAKPRSRGEICIANPSGQQVIRGNIFSFRALGLVLVWVRVLLVEDRWVQERAFQCRETADGPVLCNPPELCWVERM